MVDKCPSRSPYAPSAADIIGLRIFESVARHSSFSRAAEELDVSQPYVSTQIHEFESKLELLFSAASDDACISQNPGPCKPAQRRTAAANHGIESEIAELGK